MTWETMTTPPGDPYGEEYGDWEDPINHMMITMCTGCAMCESWEGQSHEQIRAERRAAVAKWRKENQAE